MGNSLLAITWLHLRAEMSQTGTGLHEESDALLETSFLCVCRYSPIKVCRLLLRYLVGINNPMVNLWVKIILYKNQ